MISAADVGCAVEENEDGGEEGKKRQRFFQQGKLKAKFPTATWHHGGLRGLRESKRQVGDRSALPEKFPTIGGSGNNWRRSFMM